MGKTFPFPYGITYEKPFQRSFFPVSFLEGRGELTSREDEYQ